MDALSVFVAPSLRFEPWSSQTNDLIVTYRFLARRQVTLQLGMGCLAKCQNNVTEWDINLWCCLPGVIQRQHYLNQHRCVRSQAGTCSDITLDFART